MQISSFVSDSYIINLCLGYQLCLICPLILLYFLTLLHGNPGIFSPYVWTLPSKSYLSFCLIQEYSYLCGQGGDVTIYVYICVCICVHVCILVHVVSCMYVHVYVHMCMCVCVHVYVHVYVHACVYVYVHVYVHVCVYV